MALVVRETVGIAVGNDVPGAEVGLCADARVVAAKAIVARDSVFTRVLDLGEMRAG
jgi:hypothetical protein